MKKLFVCLFFPYPAAFAVTLLLLGLLDAIRFKVNPLSIINDVPPPGYLGFFLLICAYQAVMGSLPIFIASKLNIINNKYFACIAIALSGVTARIMWDDGDVFFIVQTAMAFLFSFFGYLFAWRIVKN